MQQCIRVRIILKDRGNKFFKKKKVLLSCRLNFENLIKLIQPYCSSLYYKMMTTKKRRKFRGLVLMSVYVVVGVYDSGVCPRSVRRGGKRKNKFNIPQIIIISERLEIRNRELSGFIFIAFTFLIPQKSTRILF